MAAGPRSTPVVPLSALPGALPAPERGLLAGLLQVPRLSLLLLSGFQGTDDISWLLFFPLFFFVDLYHSISLFTAAGGGW